MADITLVVSAHGDKGYCARAVGYALTVYGDNEKELLQRVHDVIDDPEGEPGTTGEIRFLYNAPLDSQTDEGGLYKHLRTGNTYVLMCEATDIITHQTHAVYRNIATGETWFRPLTEFKETDRFAKVK